MDSIPAQTLAGIRRAGLGLAAVCAVLFLLFLLLSVKENGVDCGTFGDQKSWEYILNDQDLPAELRNCDYAFDQRERKVNLAVTGAGIGIATAIATSLLLRRQNRQTATAAEARRRPKPGSYQLGDHVRIINSKDPHHNMIGQVAELLNESDGYDVTVAFADAADENFAYRYSEITKT